MYVGILGANQTEDLLVDRNEIVSSYYYDFSPRRNFNREYLSCLWTDSFQIFST